MRTAGLLGDKAAIGGLDHGDALLRGTPQELTVDIRETVARMGNTGWMLETGCTFSPQAPEANVEAVRGAVTSL